MAKAQAQQSAAASGKARLHAVYQQAIVPELMKKFGYKSVIQVPRIRKITLNMGVGEATNDKKIRKSLCPLVFDTVQVPPNRDRIDRFRIIKIRNAHIDLVD